MIMRSKVYCWLILCVSLSNQADLNDTLYHSPIKSAVSRQAAYHHCKTLGSNWDLPDYQNYTEELEKVMEREEFASVWVAYERRRLNGWQWINGSAYRDRLQATRGYHCGGVAVQGMKLQSMNCAEGGNGFVCEMPAGKSCPLMHLTQTCLILGKKWYHIGCFSSNWYEARSYCMLKGGDLAVLNTKETQLAVLGYIIEKKLFEECSWIYAGLRQEDWVLTTDTKRFTTSAGLHWAPGHPRSGSDDCVALVRVDNSFSWAVKGCQDVGNVICQNYDVSRNNSNHPDDPQSVKEYKEPVYMFPLFLALAVLTLLGVVFKVGHFFWKWSGKTYQEKTLPDEQLEPLPYTRTVVMFSSRIDDWVCKQVEVQHIDWPACDKHISVNGSYLAKCINQAFLATKSKTYLRIININALNNDGTINETVAYSILKFIKRNIDISEGERCIIDVVCLPLFKPEYQDPSELMKILWEIKQRTVVLCVASRHPDFPSSETIAINTRRVFLHEAKSTCDITVEAPKELAPGQVGDYGLGFVAGVAAGVGEKITIKNRDKQAAQVTSLFRRFLIDLALNNEATGESSQNAARLDTLQANQLITGFGTIKPSDENSLQSAHLAQRISKIFQEYSTLSSLKAQTTPKKKKVPTATLR